MTGRNRKVFETRDLLPEAPNWDLGGRVGQPEEVATAALFLAAPA